MKKAFLILVLLAACAFSQPAMSAETSNSGVELEKGWYVKIVTFWVFGKIPGSDIPNFVGESSFNIKTGNYGPFDVSYGEPDEIIVTVTENVVAYPEDSLIIPFSISNKDYYYLMGGYRYNYNTDYIYLQAFYKNEKEIYTPFWYQRPDDDGYIRSFQKSLDGDFYFKLTVVPEPAGIIALVCGLSGLGMFGIRRRRK